MKKLFTILFCTSLLINLSAQEALKSYEEEYYDFLSVTGEVQRNYLNYRTLSDSKWQAPENHLWQDNNLGTTFNFIDLNGNKSNFFLNGIDESVSLRVYGPQAFNSYNTAAPFGQNDGALWQGRGYNLSMTTGFYLQAFGFEATLKPQLSFSQNLDFDIMPTTKSSGYGYWYGFADALQRFGDTPFWNYDWGDSEIRYNFYNFTMGLGTQSVWLGPAHENPLLLSNNAATFPKFDYGFRRTSVYMPYFGWYLGDFEFRGWMGALKDSDYYEPASDEIPADGEYLPYKQYSCFSFSWAVPHIKGLTIGANRVCLSRFGDLYQFWYLNPFFAANVVKTSSQKAGEDMKASVTFDWIFEPVGLEIYSEIGVDDYAANGLKLSDYARFPFHTMTYTVGLKKSFNISEEKGLRGLINFEWNSTEGSRDYNNWSSGGVRKGSEYNFGFHYQIRTGYTNKGQWLGSGIGYGGNSQYLSFTLYSKHGYEKLFIARNNPDNNYVNYIIFSSQKDEDPRKWFVAYKANFYTGIESLWFIKQNLSVKGLFAYDLIINPLYNPSVENGSYVNTYWNNFVFNLTVQINLPRHILK